MQPELISYLYALNAQGVGPLHEYGVIVAYIKYKSDRIIAEFILRIGWKLNDCRSKVGAGGEMEWKSGWCNVGREEVVWSDLLSKNQMLFVRLYREREDKREVIASEFWIVLLLCCYGVAFPNADMRMKMETETTQSSLWSNFSLPLNFILSLSLGRRRLLGYCRRPAGRAQSGRQRRHERSDLRVWNWYPNRIY